jgi:probable F420-dependent oxidoreductase
MQRLGITIPLEGLSLPEQIKRFKELADYGYTDFWGAEASGAEGFMPMALAAQNTTETRLGTAIIPVFTRGPALLAMSAQTMSELAPNRFILGIGSSSDIIVSNWNSIPFERPYSRVRDTLRFLKSALQGTKVSEKYATFAVNGFRLSHKVPAGVKIPIYLGALKRRMLHLAGSEADGAILNFLTSSDVKLAISEIKDAAKSANRSIPEIVTRIFVIVSQDSDLSQKIGRMLLSAYLSVDVYKKMHVWFGREEQLTPVWNAWNEGDRQKALELMPAQVVNDIVINGSAEYCGEKILEYVENGVDTPVVALIPTGYDQFDAAKKIADSVLKN